ncbi:MAG: Stp1/IreP family PP2C-type Ser/Thr phosphatase, partial [Clostridia bacterium]|nr:Stp1/IreP family PP2C-type Ser/Thr phosphatase [Clostridia bacterium]
MVLDVYGASDIGCVRSLNEDSFCIYGFEEEQFPGFCVLSDGMGGHNAGEVASQKTVQFVAESLMETMAAERKELPKAMQCAVKDANERVFRMAVTNQGQQGMGATLVIAAVAQDEVYIANVGDSRAYAYRNGELMQITRDHSVVEEMLANGSITQEEARVHPQRNIITRAIGTDPIVEPDLFEYDYLAGDTLLLCSDGLTNMVSEIDIAKIVTSDLPLEVRAQKLIDMANDFGGTDNIS